MAAAAARPLQRSCRLVEAEEELCIEEEDKEDEENDERRSLLHGGGCPVGGQPPWRRIGTFAGTAASLVGLALVALALVPRWADHRGSLEVPQVRSNAIARDFEAGRQRYLYKRSQDAYCIRDDDQIGPTITDISPRDCRARCDDNPRCAVFEIAASGHRCILGTKCGRHFPSRVGTYVMVKAVEISRPASIAAAPSLPFPPGESTGSADASMPTVHGSVLPCTWRGSLRSSHPVKWVHWVRMPQSLDPSTPANSAFSSVYAAWEKSPPKHMGVTVTLEGLKAFMRVLIGDDPFDSGGMAPRVDLDHGLGYVALTQRQLAWVTVRCFLGDDTVDGNYLCQAIRNCHSTDQVYGILSMLAVLKVELDTGCQGAYIVAAKPTGKPGAVPANGHASMAPVSACLVAQSETLFGSLPCEDGVDFMSSYAPGQVVMDIAGGNIGGGAKLCNLASQDESLMHSYPEVMALSFFSHSMLHPPMMVFGARRYVKTSGANSGLCGRIQALPNLLNEDMVTAFSSSFHLQGVSMPVYDSSFVAQQSLRDSPDLDRQIGQWTAALSPEVYSKELLPLYCSLVRSVGTGPWGAGAWHGSSQWFFLATWLGTSAVNAQVKAMCGHTFAMDYYVYDDFCENGGGVQCSVCAYCKDGGSASPAPPSAPICDSSMCGACKGGRGVINRVWEQLQHGNYDSARAQQVRFQDNAFDLVHNHLSFE